jgi:hypothetical protein
MTHITKNPIPKLPNASFSGTLHFTHLNIKRNGTWLLAALHNSVAPPPTANK